MAHDYYYAVDGQRFGPVSAERIQELASSGKLRPADLIWKEGMADWVPAARLKGLFPAAAYNAMPPPPTPSPPLRAPGPAEPAASPQSTATRRGKDSKQKSTYNLSPKLGAACVGTFIVVIVLWNVVNRRLPPDPNRTNGGPLVRAPSQEPAKSDPAGVATLLYWISCRVAVMPIHSLPSRPETSLLVRTCNNAATRD